MTLNEYLRAQPRGARIALAKAVGTYPPEITAWLSGARPVPVGRAVAVETATGGAVTRQDLRPNDWHLIWPELSGGGEAA